MQLWSSRATLHSFCPAIGLIFLCVLQTSCGGGGGSSTTTSIPATTAAPVLHSITAAATSTTTAVAWTTDQAASSQVSYGLTASYGTITTVSGTATTHSVSLSNLTCATGYHYQVTSANATGQTSSSADQTFTTRGCPPVSDNFDSPTLNAKLWTLVNPTGDGVLTMNGTAATINVPAGVVHDPGVTGNGAVWLQQPIANSDFKVQVRFQSIGLLGNQDEGIIVQQDSSNFLRFDLLCDGTNLRIFAQGISGGTATGFANAPITVAKAPFWLQLQRTGDNWVAQWSTDGSNFTSAASFNFVINATSMGPYAGNANTSLINTPAFTAVVDSFMDASNLVANLDGPKPYTPITIDANPSSALVEKTLADIQGTGHLNPVAGFESPGAGIYWYEYPASGVLTDPWLKHTIVSDGNAYEDMAVMDVNSDGAVDIIASYTPTPNGSYIYWFENPRGHGGNPATDPWVAHLVGTGIGENNLALADFDGDGITDIASGSYIYFQNSPDSWTQVQFNTATRGLALLDIGSGKGRINIVSTLATNTSVYNAVWFENPLETGGNARTATWPVHVIGPTYACSGPSCTDSDDSAPDLYNAAYATGDLNGDGLMDVVIGQYESGGTVPNGGLDWFEAPTDRRNGSWVRHTVDANYLFTHNIRVADMDQNGSLDIITSEQDQSTFRRLSVFHNDGTGNFTQEILGNVEGHQTGVGDVRGLGVLDVLNSGHGYTGIIHPLQLFLNPAK